jgi:hypothetical protein
MEELVRLLGGKGRLREVKGLLLQKSKRPEF